MIEPRSPRPRVAILDDYEGIVGRSSGARELQQTADVTVHERSMSADALVEAVAGHQVLITLRERTPFPATLLERLSDVELIAQSGTHAYHVDLEAASRLGIVVALGAAPDEARAPVPSFMPELVFGLLFSLTRRIPQLRASVNAGEWPGSVGRAMHGATLGVLGMGKHGRAVAAVAQAFGMNVVAWGPTLTVERAEQAGVRRLELDELLPVVDVLSIHLRLSELSQDLLDARRLDLLRPDAIVINTARGTIIDEAALVERLADGRLWGAGLDVFAHEPLPPESPLRGLDNVVTTPHVGWTVDRIIEGFAAVTTGQALKYLEGRLASEQVSNPTALDVPRSRIGGLAS